MYYLFIFLYSLADIIASVFLERWVATEKSFYLIAGVAIFAISGLLFGWSLRHEGLAITNALAVAIPTIIITAWALIVLKEPLGLVNVCGLILIVLGILLLNR